MIIYIGIFLIALFFRLIYPSIYEFKADEAINLLLSTRLYFGYLIPPGSTTSSIGLLNPPLFIQILSPIAFITREPVFFTYFIAIINSICIGYFSYKIKKFYNSKIAVISGLQLAVLPWAVIFSRKIWTQDIVLPFILLIIILFHEINEKYTNKKLFALIVLTFFTLQIYILSIFILAPLVILVLLKIKKINFYTLIAGVVFGILPYLPYVYYYLNGGIIKVFSNPPLDEAKYFILVRLGQIISQGGISKLFASDYIKYVENYKLIYYSRVILYLQYILAPMGLILFLKTNKYKNLFIPFVIGLLGYLLFPIPMHLHYYIPFLPFLVLGSANSIVYLSEKVNSKLLYIISGLLIITALVNTFSFLHFINKTQKISGDYGDTIISRKIDFSNKTKNEEENYLFSLIPYGYFRGTFPFSRMIFNQSDLENKLENLWDNSRQNPNDYISPRKLFSYYTWDKITPDLLLHMRKSKTKDKFDDIVYMQVEDVYREESLKKVLIFSEINLWLSYPSHWKIESNYDRTYQLTSDKIKARITLIENTDQEFEKFIQINFAKEYKLIPSYIEDNLSKIVCQNNLYWCGTIYRKIINDKSYILFSYPINNDEELSSFTNEYDITLMEIINNFREL